MITANLVCTECGAHLDIKSKFGGLCNCSNCSVINVLPKSDDYADFLQDFKNANSELFNSSFYKAFGCFRQAALHDSENPELYFAMGLANNSVKYVYDYVKKCYQPICYDLGQRKMLHDTNVADAMNYSESVAVRAEYESRAIEIDRTKAKFRDLEASGVNCDVFICSNSLPQSAEDVWAKDLYKGVKNAGLIPFNPETDANSSSSLDRSINVLYALKKASIFIFVSDGKNDLSSPEVRNEYCKYYAMLSGEERALGKIVVASDGGKIQSLPGVPNGIRVLDIRKEDASKQLSEIIRSIKKTRVRIKGIRLENSIPEENIKCLVCGNEIDMSKFDDAVCECTECEYKNPLPKKNQKSAIISLINTADAELRDCKYDSARKSYAKAFVRDPLESRTMFGMALAQNRIKYIQHAGEDKSYPITSEITNDSMFASPAFLLAHALATTDKQRLLYTKKGEEINELRESFHDFFDDGCEYNVFISVCSKEDRTLKRYSRLAEKLYEKLCENGLKPFYAPIDTNSMHTDMRDKKTLYALSGAKSVVLFCDNCGDFDGVTDADYMKYFSMLPFEKRGQHGIIVVSSDEEEKRLPGIPEEVKHISLDDKDVVDKAYDLALEYAGVSAKEKKFCVVCEREVKAKSKLCPHCLCFKFESDRSSIVKKRGPKMRSFLDGKAKVVRWLADRMRIVLISAIAAILALILTITIASVLNADRSEVHNEDYNISLVASSKIFESGTKLNVTEYTGGTTYQWLINEIRYKSGMQVDDIKVYAIECAENSDKAMRLLIPLTNSMASGRSDRVTVYSMSDDESLYECNSTVSDKYIMVTTYDLGTFAVVSLSETESIGGSGSGIVSGNTSELYHSLQDAEKIDKSQYTPASVEVLEYYYNEAVYVFGNVGATQEEIDFAAENLAQSIASLVTRADFTRLEEIVSEVENDIFEHESRYTDYSFMDVESAYVRGVEILNNKNSTQQEVDDAYSAINYSIENLDKKRTGFGTFVSIVLSIVMLGVATYIMVEECEGGKSVFVWIIGIIALAIILSNNPTWSWLGVSIAEAIVISVSTFGLLVFF